MILSLASLRSDTDSCTVNMATLTVWRLGTNQYYVRVKTILNSVTTTKHYQIKKLKNLKQMFFSQIKQEEYSPQGTQSVIIQMSNENVGGLWTCFKGTEIILIIQSIS